MVHSNSERVLCAIAKKISRNFSGQLPVDLLFVWELYLHLNACPHQVLFLFLSLGRLKLNVCFASTDSGNWTRARENKTQPGEI